MKRFALRLFTLCLALVMLGTCALAETSTNLDYTVPEKLLKQLKAGSGFTGTLTLESAAAAGCESEAIVTLKPLTFDVSYLYLPAATTTDAEAESRATLSLAGDGQPQGQLDVALRSGVVYLKSSLLGDGWFSLRNAVQADTAAATVATDPSATPDVATPTVTPPSEGSLAKAEQNLLAFTSMPGLSTFALSLLARLQDVDTSKWASSFDNYTTKIDLWIEGYRQKAVLGKTDDGTTTMEAVYQIPASAVKAQLKQLLLDLLTDDDLLAKLQTLLSGQDAERYLNPSLQNYYFYAIDSLPLQDNLEISRTVSLKGDTLALSMALPMHDSQGGAFTLRYNRHKGTGDLPDENSLALQSDSLLLRLDYQTYNTMTGTTVYQGTLLRQPKGQETFEVGANSTPQSEAGKAFSAAFTLSSQQTSATDANNRDTLQTNIELTLSPEYTPDVAGDEATEPTDAQKAQFIVFKPMDIKLGTTLASGQANNAGTSVDVTLEMAGEQFPEVIKASFSGKTTKKWKPDELDASAATSLSAMSGTDLGALLAQAGVKAGLLLLPYVTLPAAVTETPAVEPTSAS